MTTATTSYTMTWGQVFRGILILPFALWAAATGLLLGFLAGMLAALWRIGRDGFESGYAKWNDIG